MTSAPPSPAGNEARLQEAERLLRARAFQQAHALCMEALQADDRSSGAYFLLAMIAAEHANFDKALEILDRAIELDDGQARYHAQRGRCLVQLRRPQDARRAAEKARALDPQDAHTLDTIGVVLSFAGFHREAVDLFARAAALSPNDANILHNLGVSQQFSGDFAGAAGSFRKEIALRPAGGARRPYAALVQLERQTRESNFISELEAQFAQTNDALARLEIGHALAKTYEDLGEERTALEWLHRAKAARRAQVRPLVAQQEALFARAAAVAGAAPEKPGFGTDEPVFVVGMPRTGTTLVDRILSRHRDVTSAGELGHFALLAHEFTKTAPGRDTGLFDAAMGIDFEALGRAYLDATRPLTGSTPRFIDKMPLNALYAALIHRALPNARIICLRRHPMDACLSSYRQMFGRDAAMYFYAYALEDTARFYALFDRLAGAFRAALPADRFMEIAYEDIVADLEGSARRMLAFCGLDWDEACLSFHENEAPVATASSVQVRSPLYASSVGRWRRYGDALKPLADALSANGIAFD